MRPLSTDALKFTSDLSTVVRDGKAYRRLTLRYYIDDAKRKANLLQIDLEDTEPSATGQPLQSGGPPEAVDPLRFWFHFQPLAQHSANGDAGLMRDFADIDLIVYSSVKVSVRRDLKNMEHFQAIGFEGVAEHTRRKDAVLSPTRPRINLRRVHALAQIPLQGSPFQIQSIQPEFSFYVDRQRRPQYTMRSTLAAMIKRGEFADADALLLAKRTWTRVLFSDDHTEFIFLESTYQIRVYDQGFDVVDGDVAINNEDYANVDRAIMPEAARSKLHTAERMISNPKYFDYDFAFDDTRWIGGDGFQLEYRTALNIAKSRDVHLVGTIDRNVHFDRMTNDLVAGYDRGLGRRSRGTNYRDYLPALTLSDEHGRPIERGDLETSWPTAGYLFNKSAGQRVFEFQASLAIGFTPVLGELFGLYEMYTALVRDEDAFGNRLTDFEKCLVIVAAVLPLISSQTLRGAVGALGDSEVLKQFFPMIEETLRNGRTELRKLRSLQ